MIGAYAGTFDPVTRGHLEIIKRSLKLCDFLYILVAESKTKRLMFSLEERIEIAYNSMKEVLTEEQRSKIKVVGFDNLLVDVCRSYNIGLVFRGLRALVDFEYEFQLAGINYQLEPSIEMVYFVTSPRYQFVSSTTIKELFSLGGKKGDVCRYVTPSCFSAMENKLEL